MLSDILTYSIIGIIILLFLLVAARDLGMLVRRGEKAGRGLGTGASRVWAVAHTTLHEVWAAKIYLLPALWLVAGLILVAVVRPYDESERIPLYIRMLLFSQEILLLLMMGVLACLSLPRDRERKIIVTTASKPISRLEIMLGKMVGFSAAAFLVLVVMGLATWVILVVADERMRSNAQREYVLAQTDFDKKVNNLEAATVPLDKKELAEKGSLYAYNYITPAKDSFSIVGQVDRTKDSVVRYLKGGSEEKILYRFPGLVADKDADGMPQGHRPCFQFTFPYKLDANFIPRSPIELSVSAVRVHGPPQVQQATIVLNPVKREAVWELDNSKDIFGTEEAPVGEVAVTVSCPTAGVYLEIREGRQKTAEACNVVAFPERGKEGGYLPDPHPVVRGFEKYDNQQIQGPTRNEYALFGNNARVENAIFRFSGADLGKVPVDEQNNFTVDMYLDVDKEDNANLPTQALVLAYNDAAPAAGKSTGVVVNEKRDTKVTLPASLLGPDPANRRDLVILLSCQTPGHWLAMNENSVRIEKPASPFFINLLKSEAVIFCEAALLVAIGVAFSTRLGWPVALLATGTCFFLGFLRDFITNTLGLGGLISLGYPEYGVQSSTYQFFDHVVQACWKVLRFIIFLMPDFTRFDYTTSITQLRNMPWVNLGVDAGWLIVYALPFIALGYLLFRKQELG